jgi:ABC-type Fe3+-hydroxamate transport system substrate-binding protein
MPVFTDQTGHSIILNKIPEKIISIVPSQTELLYDLGLDEKVVGITKFCVHPVEWLRTKTKLGGTRQLKMDLIHKIEPDLIIANKEENTKEQVEQLAEHYPVWVSEINNLQTAFEMIVAVGEMTGTHEKAEELITRIKTNLAAHGILPVGYTNNVDQQTIKANKPKTAYLIWKNPYMTVGGDTFINSMMQVAGFENIFCHLKRYPEVTIAQLKSANCELLFLSSEPFPFKQKHIEELRIFLPNAKIILVDGEMFSWYGSRLLYAPEYFIWLNKEISINN